MKREIINKLQPVVEYFIEGKKEGKSESLGTMGTEQDGPAVVVTKGEQSVTLYGPDNVKFIKTEENKSNNEKTCFIPCCRMLCGNDAGRNNSHRCKIH